MCLWLCCTARDCALNLARPAAFWSFILQSLVVWKETSSTGGENSYGSEHVKMAIKYRAQPS